MSVLENDLDDLLSEHLPVALPHLFVTARPASEDVAGRSSQDKRCPTVHRLFASLWVRRSPRAFAGMD